MANLKDTIVLGNLTVTGTINGNIQSSGGTSGVFGSGTSGYLTKWIGSDTIANGPQIGTDTTKFLNNKGEWAVPTGTTYVAATTSALGLVKSKATGTTADRDYNVEVNADGTMKVNVPWTDTLAAQGGYADYLTGFSGRNAEISWGTLKTGYSYITRMDTVNGGSIAFADKSGQTSMQVDGFFYQNEGTYKVLDESGGTISDKLNFTYGGTRRLRLWADGEGANIRMTTPGNANNCYELDTCDSILRLYYSTDDGGGANYKSLTLMDANGVTDFKQRPTYKGTNLVTATDLSNYVDKTTEQTISGVKTFTASNVFSGETQFTNASYAPTWKDIAPGIGKSSCFTRGAFMQLITGQIMFASGSCSDAADNLGGSYNTEANKLKFQLINTAGAAAPALTTIATMDSTGLTLNYGSLYFNNSNYAGIGIGEIPSQFKNAYGPTISDYPIWIASSGRSTYDEGAGILIDGQTIKMWAPADAHPSFMDSDNGITWNIALGAGNLCFIKACTASEYANLSSKDSNTLYFIK